MFHVKHRREKSRLYFFMPSVLPFNTGAFMITEYAKEHFLELVARGSWTFAKTMKRIPHEYVVKGKTIDPQDYACMHAYIRQYGVDEKFGKQTFRYLYINGFKYWYMREKLDESICINRAKA